MRAEAVYESCGNEVRIPSIWDKPREDQMKGSPAEQLMEVCGRGCYDSMGTGRGSGDYHKNLLFTQKHYSVAEHFHFTIEVDLNEAFWLGLPDITVRNVKGLTRVTCNLRHVLEWSDNVIYEHDEFTDAQEVINGWGQVLKATAHAKCPNVFPPQSTSVLWRFVEPERDTEAFVSLFLEDSRVWSHEMVRHRGNMSQRSGRFCDETDRNFCLHPYMRDYLNEIGYLSQGVEDGDKLWTCGVLNDRDATERSQFGAMLGQHIAQGQILYKAAVDRLQDWIKRKQGIDALTARKQARSAGRYYLGNGLSTEMVFTASIRHWRHIFNMRCNPHADAAIRELMEQAYPLVKNSRWGHLL